MSDTLELARCRADLATAQAHIANLLDHWAQQELRLAQLAEREWPAFLQLRLAGCLDRREIGEIVARYALTGDV